MINYYTIQPIENLAKYVRCFWVLESDGPYTHHSMADGCSEMVFHYNGIFDEIKKTGAREKSFAAGLQGPTQNVTRYTIDRGFSMFGVYLYPFAIPQLFSLPATELTNQFPDMESLMGKKGKDLEERMMVATDNDERVKIMSAFFEKQLTKASTQQHPVFDAISGIIRANGLVRIDSLSTQYFISTRQFERKFKELTGFPPKLFSRIIRFNAALREYRNKNKSLMDIALDCGYYDQSHFISDFKEFSGLHPKQYFSGKTAATDWIDG
jgi:AraC-like DNA-binding protein